MNSNDQSQPEAPATAPAPQVLLEDSKPVAPFGPWFTATRILILTNLVVFASAMVKMGSDAFFKSGIGEAFPMKILLAMGSDYGPLTLGGEYWRVITAIFLHINFVHLFFNIFFLWVFGRALERIFSRGQALTIFLLTGVAGSLASLSWHPLVLACGASGIVYGQAGVLAALFTLANLDWARRDKNKVLVCMIFLLPFGLLFGRLPKNVDHAAHLGGFVAGLVIGILLARTLRMPQPQRTHRQWRLLVFVLEAVIVMFIPLVQLQSDAIKQHREEQALRLAQSSNDVHNLKVKRVFIHVKGNPKLVRRLEGFLKVELEDAGIEIADREAESDGVLGGEVTAEIEHAKIGFGIVKVQVTANGNVENVDFCATVGTGENIDFFDSSAGNIVQKMRRKYPNARTVKLDPASDTSASKEFDLKLPRELKKSNFTITESVSADLVLRVTLVPGKAGLEESVVNYELKMLTSKGALLSSRSNSDVLVAKVVETPPPACADNLSKLGWLQRHDAVSSVTNGLVGDLRKGIDAADDPDE